ncbi:DUF3309 family protein [Vogesella indigofera]|uniref:DUF3309 family protein n=1 Tax=Vogesella indigofera TaxID=45465 RepID=UPI003F8E9E34
MHSHRWGYRPSGRLDAVLSVQLMRWWMGRLCPVATPDKQKCPCTEVRGRFFGGNHRQPPRLRRSGATYQHTAICCGTGNQCRTL